MHPIHPVLAWQIFKIDDHMGIAISGLTADGRILCRYMRNECLNHRCVRRSLRGRGEGEPCSARSCRQGAPRRLMNARGHRRRCHKARGRLLPNPLAPLPLPFFQVCVRLAHAAGPAGAPGGR